MGLNQEQANLMISAIDMKDRKAIELMIPLKNTFMISFDDALDKFKLGLILDKGFSRIPVYANDNRNDIVGIFYVSNFRYFENQAIDWSRL
jgi:metal transporter CNNM